MFSNWLLFNLAEASLTQKQFAKLVNVNQVYRARICKIFAELIPHKTYDQLMKELR
jgi:hypothetical protein